MALVKAQLTTDLKKGENESGYNIFFYHSPILKTRADFKLQKGFNLKLYFRTFEIFEI